jgi:predicted phosphoribosyltransferase
MRAAVTALKKLGPARVIVAVPIASLETSNQLRSEADEVICALTPEPLFAVAEGYDDFSQTTDEEVRRLLQQAERGQALVA